MIPLRDLVRWREEVGRSLLNLDFRVEDDHPFSFQISPIILGEGVKVVRNSHGPGHTFRDRELIRDGNNGLALVYPIRGTLNYTQGGEGTLRSNGDAKLLICDQVGQLGAKTASNYMSIIFQPEELPSGIDVKKLARSTWHGGAPAMRLLRSYIDTLNGALIPPGSELARVAHQHILDLIRLAASESAQTESAEVFAAGTISEARVRIACADIARSFRDPSLSEATVAARQGISTRQLQRIFELAGMTFTSYVQELRLKAAYEVFSNAPAGGLSVSEVALASGFSDISHFNRLFRRRYGRTPSDVRRRVDRE